jgi:serine/threonine protein kinase
MSPGELLHWLAENQFLPGPQVEEIRALLSTFPHQHALVKELVRRNWLTPFQANQILTDHAASLVFGPFRMLERIGEGAMGQVFRAWHTRLGKFVAIKMLHQNLLANAKAMDRFRQEMATAAQLDHLHIVRVQDAGEVGDCPYMVMDYCEGINLSQLVKKQGALPIHLACDYIRQAAVGLQHAAERGVVHRDLKPSNLLLTKGQIKILDFGLARATTMAAPGRLTLVGNLLGTVDYVAPEQIENAQNADVRSDIYSLGCTLYYLLAGRPPFSGNTLLEKVSGRLLGQIPDVRNSRPEVSLALDGLLKRIMAHKAQERIQSAAELAQALHPFSQPLAVPVATKVLPALSLPVSAPATVPANPPAKTESTVRAAGPTIATALPVGISRSKLVMLWAAILGLALLFVLFAAFRGRISPRTASVGPVGALCSHHAPRDSICRGGKFPTCRFLFGGNRQVGNSPPRQLCHTERDDYTRSLL